MEQKCKPHHIYGIALIAAISLFSGVLGAYLFTNLNAPGTGFVKNPDKVIEERTYIEESQSIDAIEKAKPSVLSIVATKDLQIFQQQNPFDLFFNDPFFQQIPGFQFQFPQQRQQKQAEPETKRQKIAGGTGFIVSDDGFSITNKHVVNDPEADYTAITSTGKEYDIEILSQDPLNDLAIIQLHEKSGRDKDRKTGTARNFGAKAKGLQTIKLGDSNTLKVGQKVFAIGNARGEYENSVTAGIISAIGRQIEASDQMGGFRETLSNLIQTDAAINFGNSGGPLINLAGEVIGVNTAIDASAAGVGFAIPINEVKAVLDSVSKYGKIVRPILGVRHIMLNKEKAEQLGLKGLEYGALIAGDRTKGEFPVVPGSPAEKAGLRVDDVILEVDSEKIDENTALQSVVRRHKPGDTLKLKVWRAGSTFDVNVKLDELQGEKAK